jgi:cytochrome c-type biogenesis protein
MSWSAITAAFGLGVLTAMLPCSLAGSIAAISFITRGIARGRHVLLSGLLYALGQAVAYELLALGITAGLLASGQAGRFLHRYLTQTLGPVLILAGMFLLELLGTRFSLRLAGEGIQRRASAGGALWGAPLGLLLALSFCPSSAGVFFGVLIPLATAQHSPVLLPLAFAAGAALPVVAFAFLLAFAGRYVGSAFNRLIQVERWVRLAAGIALILAGVYFCLTAIFGVSLLR